VYIIIDVLKSEWKPTTDGRTAHSNASMTSSVSYTCIIYNNNVQCISVFTAVGRYYLKILTYGNFILFTVHIIRVCSSVYAHESLECTARKCVVKEN
jgi:hypothetical protein